MQNFFEVDLFAGCGGISEGFHQAGFNTIAQVEMHGPACETLRTRQMFHELVKRRRTDLYDEYVRGLITKEQIFCEFEDIREAVSHRVIQETLSEDSIQPVIVKIRDSMEYHETEKIHVFLGGPPCQPYSIINRARIQKKGDALGRNYLYEHYLALMQEFEPDFFIYENVPGLFTATDGGQRIFEKLLTDFLSLRPAYEIVPPLHEVSKNPHNFILNSSNYRIPQGRKRLIVIGYKKDLEEKNKKIRHVYSKLRNKGILSTKNQLTVKDAIGDLPFLKPEQGDNRFFGKYPQHEEKLSLYQKRMRQSSHGVLNHFARSHMASDLDRYRFFIEYYEANQRSANIKDLIKMRPDLIPDHKNLDKFIDRFKVQGWSKPSSTITAHISKDGHYYIHPDINQCRSFTVREAARCQSFPDNFFFEGPRTEQFRQVGNAVPPLLAKSIGMSIRHELEKIYSEP